MAEDDTEKPHEATAKKLEDARKKILQLQNMIAAGQHMSAFKDINALIAASVSAAKDSIHADRCSLFMYSKESIKFQMIPETLE